MFCFVPECNGPQEAEARLEEMAARLDEVRVCACSPFSVSSLLCDLLCVVGVKQASPYQPQAVSQAVPLFQPWIKLLVS